MILTVTPNAAIDRIYCVEDFRIDAMHRPSYAGAVAGGKGVNVARVDLCWLVREDAVEGVDYEVERVTAFWRATGEQAWKLCEDSQAGVSSRRYQPGPLAPSEQGIETFLQWYIQQIRA